MTAIDKIICKAELFKMLLKRDKNTSFLQATLKTALAQVTTSHLAS
jgi:hypothetical protein